MTLAIDRTNGKVIGQVTRYTDALASADPYRRKPATLTLLTKEGYVTVPADSVRVEEVR
jgi:hypothetical protein